MQTLPCSCCAGCCRGASISTQEFVQTIPNIWDTGHLNIAMPKCQISWNLSEDKATKGTNENRWKAEDIQNRQGTMVHFNLKHCGSRFSGKLPSYHRAMFVPHQSCANLMLKAAWPSAREVSVRTWHKIHSGLDFLGGWRFCFWELLSWFFPFQLWWISIGYVHI